MKFLRFFVLALLVTSCASINVNYDYDKSIDFTKYKTYHYYRDLDTGLSALDAKRLLSALDMAMQAKGFTLSETPDIFINITSEEFENLNRNNVGIGVGGTGRNVGGGVSIGLPVGQSRFSRQIVFEFVDENGVGLIWEAISESRYNPNATPERREADLRAIVTKVIDGFPPKGK